MVGTRPDQDLARNLTRNAAAGDLASHAEIEAVLAHFLRDCCPAALSVNVAVHNRAASGLTCENWIFTVQWKFADRSEQQKMVLRKGRPGGPMEVSRAEEYRVLQALHAAAAFPTPAPLWLGAESNELGQPFLIMEFLKGKNDRGIIARDSTPLDVRIALAESSCRILADLHNLDWEEQKLQGLGAQYDAAGQVMSPLAYWRHQYEIFGLPLPETSKAIAWLAGNEPPTDRLALVHGDFRPGNMLIDEGRITAVLDWETAHISDPLEDVGWYTIPHHYREEHFVPGSFDLCDFLSLYGSLTGNGINPQALAFWQGVGVLKTMAMLARAQTESPQLYGELTAASLEPYAALFRKIRENAC